jgi:dUTP pyrophosphatase
MPRVPVQTLPHFEGLEWPRYQTAGAAGMDLRAAVEAEGTVLEPGRGALIPTGLRVAIPEGFEGQIRARSGLALKHSLGVLNAPGTIDSDYRGEIKVLLFNFGAEPVRLERGDRIAQLVLARVERIEWEAAESLPPADRGEGGFGGTGLK